MMIGSKRWTAGEADSRSSLRANRRRFDRHAAGPLHQIELRGQRPRGRHIRRARRARRSCNRASAAATSPGPAIRDDRADSRSGGLAGSHCRRAACPSCRHDTGCRKGSADPLGGGTVASRARGRPQFRIASGRDRQAARLAGDKGGQRQQIRAFPCKWLGSLMLGAAPVDALLEIERSGEHRVEGRVARRDALHADARRRRDNRRRIARRRRPPRPTG